MKIQGSVLLPETDPQAEPEKLHFTSTPVTTNQVARDPHLEKYTSEGLLASPFLSHSRVTSPHLLGLPFTLPTSPWNQRSQQSFILTAQFMPCPRTSLSVLGCFLYLECPMSLAEILPTFQDGVQIPPPMHLSSGQFLSPPNSTFSLYVYYRLSNFAILVYGLLFRVGGKRSQLCPPECLKQYLWKVLNWVY